MPKSVLRYELDKSQYLGLETSFTQSCVMSELLLMRSHKPGIHYHMLKQTIWLQLKDDLIGTRAGIRNRVRRVRSRRSAI